MFVRNEEFHNTSLHNLLSVSAPENVLIHSVVWWEQLIWKSYCTVEIFYPECIEMTQVTQTSVFILECNWQESERFPPRLIFASINQRLMSCCTHTCTHTYTHSCADMNSSHWCVSLWGLLPVWVLCWAGKWWWVNWSTPGLCYTPPPNPTTDTHTHTHRCYCSPLHVFPCLPASWAPALPAGTFLLRPCQMSLCSHSLLLCFHCHSFFITLFARSSLLLCVCYQSTADLPHSTKHNMTHGRDDNSCMQALIK